MNINLFAAGNQTWGVRISGIQKSLNLTHKLPPGRFVLQQDVVFPFQQDEARPGDQIGQYATFFISPIKGVEFSMSVSRKINMDRNSISMRTG
jgi:hypothetical protein